MVKKAIYEIIRTNSGVTNISDNMNLYRDLGIGTTSLKKICISVEKFFGVPDGALKDIIPYFDKITVSDLIKITKSEVNCSKKQNIDNEIGFFDKLKAHRNKVFVFFHKHR